MNEALQKEIASHLAKHPEAAAFLNGYGLLCHAVDDLIDRDNPKIARYETHVLDCYNLALDVYSSPFYQKNVSWIYPLAKNIHRVWSASVVWERFIIPWQAQYADFLRCCGNEMILAVLEHLCHLPYNELRRLDGLIREDSWARHHDKEGKPI